MNPDPLMDMTSNPVSTPAPGAVVAPPVEPDVSPAPPTEAPAPPPPAPEPVVIPDLGPEPTVPGSDPASQQAQIISALQRQIEMLNAKLTTPVPQPRQQPKSDPAVDDLLDDTPAWAKDIKQEVLSLKQQQEAARKIEEGARRNAQVQSEMSGAAAILNESSQQYQITKEHPEVHGLIANFLGGQIQSAVERNPFGHGITKESVQTAYAQLAQQIHKAFSSVVSKRQQSAAAQVQANAQTAALTGGTAVPTNSGPKHTGDLLTNEQYWNKEVDILLNSAVAKVTGQ